MKKPARAPAVILINPKFAHNVGSAVRACACWGIDQLYWTGDRVNLEIESGHRLPREERMKGYKMVDFRHHERPLNLFQDAVPIAIEVRENSESLITFEHPENAVYVFGPEDDSLRKPITGLCHRFVMIPTHFCLNLGAAVNIILWDRRMKRQLSGKEPMLPANEMLKEHRGFVEDEFKIYG